MAIDLKKISTESRNPNTLDIDEISTIKILDKINNEDQIIAPKIKEKLSDISLVVDEVYEKLKNGGRLIYMGAGTSGRIGIIDAVECPPTFGVDYEMVQCLMAGGKDAFVKAKEGAEDNKELGIRDLKDIHLSSKDFVIGIAASGRTPYVIGGIEYAKKIGAKTACITTSSNSILASLVDYKIEIVVGPEVITGSTRMKSGTCQKMVCNMISTSVMIKLGKVYSNLMVDVKPTNEKLIQRSLNIIHEITDVSLDEARILLDKYHTIKKVIFHYFTNVEDEALIDKYLNKCSDNVKLAIKLYKEENI